MTGIELIEQYFMYSVLDYLGDKDEWKPMKVVGTVRSYVVENWMNQELAGWIERKDIMYKCTEKGKLELQRLRKQKRDRTKIIVKYLLILWGIISSLVIVSIYTNHPIIFAILIFFGFPASAYIITAISESGSLKEHLDTLEGGGNINY